MSGWRFVAFVAAPVFAVAASASWGGQPHGQADAPPPAGDRCVALMRADLTSIAARSRVDTAGMVAAVDGKRPLPAHCEIRGTLEPRVGVDGQPYAVRFHLRLPTAWNGRFFFEGGGGSDGVVGDALGDLTGTQPEVALQRGYAVISQDAGHDNAVNDVKARGGVTSFGWDPIARRNYAYRSLGLATAAGKRLVRAFYGRDPAFSYFVGCSKGGQEGMAVAERFPDQFNGIIANAPGFALPRAAMQQAFDTQQFAKVATALGRRDADGAPLLNASYSDADLALVSAAVLKACDADDGVADGIVASITGCTTAKVRQALAAVTCGGAKRDGCLVAAQVEGIAAVYRGSRGADGRPIYSDWPWDPGLGGAGGVPGWRRWKLGSAGGTTNDARNILLGAASLASVFTNPPRPVADTPAALLQFQLGLRPGDAAAIYAAAPPFGSPWAELGAQSSDRRAFERAGGRMIVVHGGADPVFSVNDTARWWDRLDAAEHGRAADHARLFVVPGMGHCRGGPATSGFAAFAALVDWVERGRAPDTIVATAPADTPWPGRTRPLCRYPMAARYRGRGSIEQAASFECVAGPRVPAIDVERTSNG